MTPDVAIDRLQAAEQALTNPSADNLSWAAEAIAAVVASTQSNPAVLRDQRMRRRVHNLNLLIEQAGRLRLSQSSSNWALEG